MLNNKNMITLFIWLGVIGGILIALSVAGYKIYSGKINNERESNSILQRNEIKDNINESKNDLSEQIDKNDVSLRQTTSLKTRHKSLILPGQKFV